MAICGQCGKKFVRSWGQMFSGPEKFNNCLECVRENQNIKRVSALQEAGKIQAQQEAREGEIRKKKRRNYWKDVVRRSPYG